jgi:gamma-glutamylaminecyclotransferase
MSFACEAMSVATFVFVYGTLKAGFSNHHWMGAARLVTKAQTSDLFAMYRAPSYPYLSKLPALYRVQGELYEADEELMKKLDILEGAPDYYFREVRQSL